MTEVLNQILDADWVPQTRIFANGIIPLNSIPYNTMQSTHQDYNTAEHSRKNLSFDGRDKNEPQAEHADEGGTHASYTLYSIQ